MPFSPQHCIVELMGHGKIAGLVSEETIAGGSFLRVDVLGVGGIPPFTRFYSPGAVYCVTPVDEPTCIMAMEQFQVKPVYIWSMPELRSLEAGDDDQETEFSD